MKKIVIILILLVGSIVGGYLYQVSTTSVHADGTETPTPAATATTAPTPVAPAATPASTPTPATTPATTPVATPFVLQASTPVVLTLEESSSIQASIDAENWAKELLKGVNLERMSNEDIQGIYFQITGKNVKGILDSYTRKVERIVALKKLQPIVSQTFNEAGKVSGKDVLKFRQLLFTDAVNQAVSAGIDKSLAEEQLKPLLDETFKGREGVKK